MNEYRIRSGMSTRIVQLTTGENVHFSAEGLARAAQQVNSGFVPMGVEHLSYLPPRGRLTRGELLTDDDGESELILYGKDLQFLRAGEMSLKPTGERGDEPPAEVLANVTIGVERRNYTSEAWERIVADSPIPIEDKSSWSDLPPLIWMLAIPVTWGAIRFAGSFLDRLGTASADRFIGWVKRAATSSKDPERETLIEIRFILPDGGPSVLGFAPLDAQSDASIAALLTALEQAGLLAEFAGSVAAGQQPRELRQCAFQWDSDQWRLAWWATDEAVFVTPWFSGNYPDPQRFLGRPLLPSNSEGENDLNLPTIEDS